MWWSVGHLTPNRPTDAKRNARQGCGCALRVFPCPCLSVVLERVVVTPLYDTALDSGWGTTYLTVVWRKKQVLLGGCTRYGFFDTTEGREGGEAGDISSLECLCTLSIPYFPSPNERRRGDPSGLYFITTVYKSYISLIRTYYILCITLYPIDDQRTGERSAEEPRVGPSVVRDREGGHVLRGFRVSESTTFVFFEGREKESVELLGKGGAIRRIGEKGKRERKKGRGK